MTEVYGGVCVWLVGWLIDWLVGRLVGDSWGGERSMGSSMGGFQVQVPLEEIYDAQFFSTRVLSTNILQYFPKYCSIFFKYYSISVDCSIFFKYYSISVDLRSVQTRMA